MASVESKKRKREDDPCRIIYHAPGGLIFERVFKEASLEQTKDTVREKLGLPPQTAIHLTQIREGKAIVLEDDCDFESFHIVTRTVPAVDVRVIVGDRPGPRHTNLTHDTNHALSTSASLVATPGRKRKKARRGLAHLPTPSLASEQAYDGSFTLPSLSSRAPIVTEFVSISSPIPNRTDAPPEVEAKKEKRRRVDNVPPVEDQPVAGPSTGTLASVTEDKGKRKKRKSEVMTRQDLAQQISTPSASSEPGGSSTPVLLPTDEAVAPPKKRKRKSVVPTIEEPAKNPVTPAPVADEVPSLSAAADDDSFAIAVKKKKKSRKSEQEVVHPATDPAQSHVEPEPIQPAIERKKKQKQSKRLKDVAPSEPASLPPSEVTPAEPPATQVAGKKKSKKSKNSKDTHAEPTPTVSMADDVRSISRRQGLETSLATRNDVSSDATPAEVDPEGQGSSEPKKKKKKSAKESVAPVGPPADVDKEESEPKKRRKSGKVKAVEENSKEQGRGAELARATSEADALERTPDVVAPSKSKPPKVQTAEQSAIEKGDAAPPSCEASVGTSVVHAPTLPAADVIPNKWQKNMDLSRQKRRRAEPSCPICCGPFHLRFTCPIVRNGSNAIKKRLEELRKEDGEQDQQLIQDLETFLEKTLAQAAKRTESASSNVSSRAQGKTRPTEPNTSLLASATFPSMLSPATPVIPAESVISEVIMQGQGEGSSDESSGDEDEGRNSESEIHGRALASTEAEVAQTELEALIRGPAFVLKRRVIDMVPSSSSNSDNEDHGDDGNEEEVALEEEEEPKRKRASKHGYRSDSSDHAWGAAADSDDEDLAPPVYMDESRIVERDNEIHSSGKSGFTPSTPMTAEHAGEESESAPKQTGAQSPQDKSLPEGADIMDSSVPIAISTTVVSEPSASQSSLDNPKLSYNPDAMDVVNEGPTTPDTSGETELKARPLQEDFDVTMEPPPEVEEPAARSPSVQCSAPQPDSSEEHRSIGTAPAEVAKPSAPGSLPRTLKSLKPITSHIAPTAPAAPLHLGDGASARESIEGAEDLLEARTPMKNQDPIVNEDDDDHDHAERSPSPVHSTPRSGIAKRMRNRFGMVPFPVPEEVEGERSAQAEEISAEPAGDDPASASQASATGGMLTRRARESTRILPIEPEPSVPEEPPITRPKRRRRQPLSEEEKARRAAAKQAEKEEKARLRKDKQEQAKAAKTAAKEAERAEKEATKAAEKEEKKRKAAEAKNSKKRGRKITVVTDLALAEPETDKESSLIPKTLAPDNDHDQEQSAVGEQSLVQWSTLDPSQEQSAETDELLPSTPGFAPQSFAGDITARPEWSSSSDLDGVQEMVLNRADESVEPRWPVGQSPPRDALEDITVQTPLFLPSESHTQGPYSGRDLATLIRASSPAPDQSETEDEAGEELMPPPPKKTIPASQPAPRPSTAPYRRLTDIASSQSELFAPKLNLPPALARKPAEKATLSELYSEEEESDDDDDDDDSDEGSEKEGKSHIPKNRKAGSGMTTRRTSGLLAHFGP